MKTPATGKVYFCINGQKTCTGPGTYFIADYAFVKQVKDEFNNVIGWDVVIADCKLLSSTGLTVNQNTAKGLSSFYIKSYPVAGVLT